MVVLSFFYQVIDIPNKFFFKIVLKSRKYLMFSETRKSDSDSTPYSNYVSKVLADQKQFRRFRKKYSYRVILEHVTYGLGRAYFKKLNKDAIATYLSKRKLHELNKIGSPRLYKYTEVGWISPTMLRYLFVNQTLIELFDGKKFNKVAEIGIGFGGQLCVSLELLEVESYSIYDLPQVSELAKKVVRDAGFSDNRVITKSIESLSAEEYDLVISNYAFSELPFETQLDYATKVLRGSKRGYLIMNSGRTNYSGRSTGKMSLNDLFAYLPEFEVFEEDPLTGPDNYVIAWGHKIPS